MRAKRAFLVAMAAVLGAGSLGAGPAHPLLSSPELGSDIPAGGAFTCDFALAPSAPLDKLAPLLERDRIYMTRRPGMFNKHLPLRVDALTAEVQSGGRYLFDTYGRAKDYLDWLENGFLLDGELFLDRPVFVNPDCHAWSTIGAAEFGDIADSQVLVRTERWEVPADNQRPLLNSRWPVLRETARARGFTGVWLLYDPADDLVSVVYFADRALPLQMLDPVGLLALELAHPLGAVFDDQGWPKTMDRSHWVLTIWFANPAGVGDRGAPSLWPNSPPLPEPTTSDGVCVPNRGENSTTAPQDCTPKCGDEIWDAGEDNYRCPSDVPHF